MVEWFHRHAPKQTSSTAHDVSSIVVTDMRSVVLGTPRVKTILHGARSPHCLALEVRSPFTFSKWQYVIVFVKRIRSYI